MGGNEAQFIISHLGKQITDVAAALESSRQERHKQVESLRLEMQQANKVLHKRVSDEAEKLRALELSHAANLGKCSGTGNNDDWLKDIGSIDGAKKRVTGLVALALVILLGLAIIIWGPAMVTAMRGKAPAEKVVTHP